jgi:hypothetical protein
MAGEREEFERLKRCITMAMGCISPLSKNPDERLAWYRLLDALEGREPREQLEERLRPPAAF